MAYDVFLPFYFSLLIVISPQFSLSELSLLLGKLIVVSLVCLQPVMLYFEHPVDASIQKISVMGNYDHASLI